MKNREIIPASDESKQCGKRILELRKAKRTIDTIDVSLGQQLVLTFPDGKGNKITIQERERLYLHRLLGQLVQTMPQGNSIYQTSHRKVS